MDHAILWNSPENLLKHLKIRKRNFLHIFLMQFLPYILNFYPIFSISAFPCLDKREKLEEEIIGTCHKMFVEAEIGVICFLFIYMPMMLRLIGSKKGLYFLGDHHTPKSQQYIRLKCLKLVFSIFRLFNGPDYGIYSGKKILVT